MSTPGPAAQGNKIGGTQADGEAGGQGKPVHFATFSAHNAAAVHLLEAVHASGASPCLVSDEDTVSYYLALPSAANHAGFTQPAVDRWRLGAGPSAALTEKGVDHCKAELLLCPPGHTPGSKRARSNIKDVHAPIIYRDGDVNGYDLTLHGGARGQDSCVLFRPRNKIILGEYEFLLDFTLDNQQAEQFLVQRNTLLLHTHNSIPSRHLAPVPTKDHSRLWNVRVHHVSQAADSAHDAVYFGVQLHTGLPVAVKRMLYEKNASNCVKRELEVASIFGADLAATGVLGSLDSWCEHGESPPCWLQGCAELQEDVFYSMPLAEYNFKTMPWAKLNFEKRSDYLYQTLCGLSEFHTKAMIHGRIRPTSLLILPHEKASASSEAPGGMPERAVISPAVTSHEDRPELALWVAPEAWSSTQDAPHTDKADVWAVAASWLQAFAAIPDDVATDARSYRRILKTLDTLRSSGKITEAFKTLLLWMLAWNPEDRPSVAEAMSHAVWAPVRRQMELRKENSRRQREEKVRGPGDEAKKVRILSPDVEP